MKLLERKIDHFLEEWKKELGHLPLIVKGARQIGKTESIRHFGKTHYTELVEINFVLQRQYRDIFHDGYEVDRILRNISLRNGDWKLIPGETLLFFDELQACPDAATSLKAFRQDGRYDVICSGSLMGINYREIESNSVGNKQDVQMYSMDFEEFLWAMGYHVEQLEELYQCMRQVLPLSDTQMDVMTEHFLTYLVLGGMPAVVSRFVQTRNYSGTLSMQKQLLLDYEEDITKYAGGLDQTKILNVYRMIPVFLGKANRKFQISKVAKGARSREYVGITEWLANAGIVHVCHCLKLPELPLKGNYEPDNYRLYFGDPGLLVGSLDEEAQEDLRYNRNFNAYKGAIYENMIADMLAKQGLDLYFYKNEKGTLEMDFFVRDSDSLVPVEVKARDGATPSLRHLIEEPRFSDIRYGIKLGAKNIGFNGNFYTFPWFLAIFLKRFLREGAPHRRASNESGQ